MLVLLSPAKTWTMNHPDHRAFQSAGIVIGVGTSDAHCRNLTPAQLASLMSISDKLAGLNAARLLSGTGV